MFIERQVGPVRRVVFISTALAALALLAAGCGSVEVEGNVNRGDEVAGSDMEELILPELEAKLEEAGGEDIELDLDCPAGTKSAKGTTFECAILDGETEVGRVLGEMTGGDEFDWSSHDFFDAGSVEDEIRRVAEERSLSASEIACPERQVMVEGRTFTCEVDGQFLEVEPTDDAGALQFGDFRDAPIEN
jgi:hypothetical protein